MSLDEWIASSRKLAQRIVMGIWRLGVESKVKRELQKGRLHLKYRELSNSLRDQRYHRLYLIK